ncbi:hypothetical protein P7C71_g5875, partial [Lecanoromycetidae sp. Uapishka_2]
MPAMLEDPTAPAIYRVSGVPPYPTPTDPQIPDSIRPRQNFGAIMLLGEVSSVEDVVRMEENGVKWEEVCLGSFYVKPNYPGRSSHVCNGGFLVTEAARNRGVGRLMGEGYLEWAPRLGYSYSVFNLVYETNVASCRIWDALGFRRIGRVKACGNLRSHPDELVDAIIYGRDLGPDGEEYVSEERFDKIRYYLRHGTYPSGADRAEKSRLRSAATHYKLVPDEHGQGERLMLKDKEVVSDPQRQYEISRKVHTQGHGGINKTTATIAEKYHWVRIKETVSLVIKNCPECKELAAKTPTIRPVGDNYSAGAVSQLRRAASGMDSQGINDPNSMIERLVNYEPNRANLQNFPPPRPQEGDRNAVPVANMRALQEYNDIPLDPQIMRHDAHQQYNNGGYGDQGLGDKAYASEMDMTHSHSHSGRQGANRLPDTRMATERHVRRGDDAMAFQDADGLVNGDGGGMQDGEDGVRNAGDLDLEELLRRS